LFHIPDLRAFWKVPQAWKWRDLEQTTLEDQPNEAWNGVYLKFFSFDLDNLPENRSVPLSFCRVNLLAAGDVFIVKLAPQEWDEHGWAVYEDIPPEFLEYCFYCVASPASRFASRLASLTARKVEPRYIAAASRQFEPPLVALRRNT